MTGAEFTARYRLREQVHDGPVTTFRAIDARGGKVFVHVFRDPSVPPFDRAALDARGSDAVREVLDVEAIGVVVTGEIEPFTTFEEWMASRQLTEDAGEPGAYTRIFRIQPQEPMPSPESKHAAADPAPSPIFKAPVARDADAPIDPGPSDTARTPRAPEATRPVPQLPRAGPEASSPGEYTMLFRSASDAGPPRPPSPPAPRQPYPEHSTYSRIMSPSAASASPPQGGVPVPPPPATPAPPETPPSSPAPLDYRHAGVYPPAPPRAPAEPSSGMYTMIMRPGGAPPASTPSPVRPAQVQPPSPPAPTRGGLESDLYADNYLHRLRDPGPDVTPHNIPAPQEPPRFDRSLYEPPATAEPGSYTMIIGRGATPAPAPPGFGASGYPAPPPPPPASSPPPPKGPSKTPLVIGLVLIVAILAGVIIFLAARQS